MSTDWLDDAQLDALLDAARGSRSKAVRFDPDAAGGFRLLTDAEDRDLIDAIALPHQRGEDDRAHLAREQATAQQVGDRDAVAQAVEHQRVLGDEQARDQRADPRLPTRAELDAIYARGDREGWTEQSARAVEYLDLRRDIADERADAVERGDYAEVSYLDRQHQQVERTYARLLGVPERDGNDQPEHDQPEHDDSEHPDRQAPQSEAGRFEAELFSGTHGGAQLAHQQVRWGAREIEDEEPER